MDKFVTKKPICKFGAKCYRKNPEHLKEFAHPKSTAEKAEEQEDVDNTNEQKGQKNKEILVNQEDDKTVAAKRPHEETECDTNKVNDDDDSEKETAPKRPKKQGLNVISPAITVERKEILKEKFLFEMPEDFYNLWTLASRMNKSKPANAFEAADIKLVGPFDVFSGYFDGEQNLNDSDHLLHWRFYNDLPEVQTVIVGPHTHIAYMRDDSKELPTAVCSIPNETVHFPKITIVGDNLFAGIKVLLEESKAEEAESLIERVERESEKIGYSMNTKSTLLRERKKKIVAPTLHGAGIVVPVINDVGYRDLGESNVTLKKLLTIIGTTDEEKVRDGKMERIQEIITYIQFANDEADFGMGLELGHDLFNSGYSLFHHQISQLLSVAYMLLNRPEFGKILEAHLANRKEGCDLSVI